MAVLFASQTMAVPQGAAVASPNIATNAVAACNCPNNCSHKAGDSCKYYGGSSDKTGIISGHCYGSPLTCQG
ncbi:MAG: hypothetical protein M1812_002705 [Candelaria pacifica]|nr:MAG: hypothetical protein M1812_002705 [Candelaria pacifica]